MNSNLQRKGGRGEEQDERIREKEREKPQQENGP